MGDAVAIIVGQLLGANKMKEARETDTKIIVFSVLCCLVTSTLCSLSHRSSRSSIKPVRRARNTPKPSSSSPQIFMPQNAFCTRRISPFVRVDRLSLPSCLTASFVVCERTAGVLPEPLYDPPGDVDLNCREYRRLDQVHHGLCAGAQGCLDEKHRHQFFRTGE